MSRRDQVIFSLLFHVVLLTVVFGYKQPGPSGPETRNKSAPSPQIAEFPFDFSSGHIEFPVRINDSAPLVFALDTGWPQCAVDTRFTKNVNFQSRDSSWNSPKGPAGLAQAGNNLRQGPLLSWNGFVYQPEQLQPTSFVRWGDSIGNIRGIIGDVFFRDYVVEIDYSKQRIRLFNPTNYSYSGNGAVFPLKFPSYIPVFEVSVPKGDSTPLPAFLKIDTGSLEPVCFHKSFVNANGLRNQIKFGKQQTIVGFDGPTSLETGRLPLLNVGKLKLRNVHVYVRTLPARTDEEETSHGVVGNEFLREFKVVLNYHQKQLILEPR